MTLIDLEKWFPYVQTMTDDEKRLVCYPFAGAGASTYQPWALTPTSLKIWSVQLPGHETRIREKLISHARNLIVPLATALMKHMDTPCAFFGHSMGALLAFEVIRELRRQQAKLPVCLFVSAANPPHLIRTNTAFHQLDDAALVEKVSLLNGTVPSLLKQPAFLELMLPIIRADFKLCETYAYTEEPPLDIPLFALGGEDDPLALRENVQAWSQHTAADFQSHFFPGGHFFIKEQTDVILELIEKQMIAVMKTGSFLSDEINQIKNSL